MNEQKERELFEECLISKTNLVTDGLVNWNDTIGRYVGVRCHELMADNINLAHEVWQARAKLDKVKG